MSTCWWVLLAPYYDIKRCWARHFVMETRWRRACWRKMVTLHLYNKFFLLHFSKNGHSFMCVSSTTLWSQLGSILRSDYQECDSKELHYLKKGWDWARYWGDRKMCEVLSKGFVVWGVRQISKFMESVCTCFNVNMPVLLWVNNIGGWVNNLADCVVV